MIPFICGEGDESGDPNCRFFFRSSCSAPRASSRAFFSRRVISWPYAKSYAAE